MKKLHGWKTCLLGDVVTTFSGGTPSRSNPDYFRGDIPWIKSGELNAGCVTQTEEFISEEGLRKSAAKLVEPGTTLLALYGATAGVVGRSNIKAAINQAILAVVPNEKFIDLNFLQFLLKNLSRNLLRVVQGAQPNLNAGMVRDAEVDLPPLPEQRKIADILSTWDESLETLDALIAAKTRQKQALLQQLLDRSLALRQTAHARHRLGEVCERVTRRNNISSENVLTISAQQGLVSQKDYFNRNVAGADLANYYLLNRGEYAYNRSSAKGYPYGAIKRLDLYECGVVSTLYLCFRIKAKAQASSDYLSQYFEAGRLNSGLRSVAKEGARAHGLLNVTADEFFDLDIFLPPLAEQQQIATILGTADQELTLLRTQRQTLDQQKRGLMQRLLTGKLRVTP